MWRIGVLVAQCILLRPGDKEQHHVGTGWLMGAAVTAERVAADPSRRESWDTLRGEKDGKLKKREKRVRTILPPAWKRTRGGSQDQVDTTSN